MRDRLGPALCQGGSNEKDVRNSDGGSKSPEVSCLGRCGSVIMTTRQIFRPAFSMNRILLFALLLTAATMAQATPVLRELHPRIQAGDGCDLDGDGVKDVTFRSYEPAHVAMGYFSFDWASVVPREGFEFLMVGSSPQQVSRVAGVKAPLTCGPTPSQGAWSQVVPEPEIGLVLGGRTHSWPRFTGDPITSYGGIVAETRTPYVGFRLKRGGQTFYGVLDAHRYPEPPVTSPPATGNDTLVITGTPPTSIVSFGAVIMETQPDTPVVIDDPRLALRDQGGATVANGSTADFGTTDLGGLATRTFTLTNDGTATLRDLAVSLSGTNRNDFALTTPAVTSLAPGESTTVSVTFVPGTAGASSAAELVIASNDPEARQFVVKLKAQAGAALIPVRVEEVDGNVVTALSPAFDFGSPMLGETMTKTFRITNTGSAPVRDLSAIVDEPFVTQYRWGIHEWPPGVTHIAMTYWELQPYQAREPSGFTVQGPASELAPGQSTLVQVTWKPFETALKTRNILITGSNIAEVKVPVSGSAQAYQMQPQALTGVHYRMWENYGAALSQPLVLSPYLFPVENELAPDMPERWLVDTAPAASVASNWRNTVSGQLSILPMSPNATTPAAINVTGEHSAKDALGSTAAVAFSGGSRFLRADLKLPARDEVGMELWFNATSATGTQCIAFIGEAADAGFGLWLVEGTLQGRVGGLVINATMLPAIGDWHHAALLMHQGAASLILDGAVAGTASATLLPELVKGFAVGASIDGTNGFEGAVDELRLFEVSPSDPNPSTSLLASALPVSEISATSLDFGKVSPGSGAWRDVSLVNRGPGWLRITSAALSGDAAGDFSFVGWSVRPLQPDPTAPPPPSNTLLDGGTLVLISRVLPAYQSTGVIPAIPPNSSVIITVGFKPSPLGHREAALTLTTSDPAHPTREIALTAEAVAPAGSIRVGSAPTWFWGSVLTSDSKSRSFYITNDGSGSLHQVKLEVIGANAEDYTLTDGNGAALDPLVFTTGVDVVSGSPLYCTITVKPKAAGSRAATLRITSDDAERPVIDIPMYGRGVPVVPEIEVKGLVYYPDALAYGSKPIAMNGTMDFGTLMRTTETSAGYVKYYNTGTGALTISRVTVSGPNASDFALDPANTGSLLAGQWDTTTVKFTPSGEGLRTATLKIESDDADEGVYEIALTGRMLPPTPVLVVDQGGANPAPLASEFLRLGTAVARGFRNANYTLPTKTLRLKNTGTGALTNARLRFTGPNANEFSATIAASIAPNASGDIVVTFNPAAIGPRSAVLHIETDAGSVGAVPVGGTGAYGAKASLNPQLPDGWVTTAMAELPDGKVVVAGFVARGSYAHKLLILQPNETAGLLPTIMDPYWGETYFDGPIKSIAPLANGSFYVAGEFARIQRPYIGLMITNVYHPPGDPYWELVSPTRAGVALMGNERDWSNTFRPPTGSFVGRAVLALPDGKVLVGGSGSLGGRKNLIRLNADGTLDTTFTLPEPDGPVNALALQDDGKVLVGGEFTNLGQAYVPGPWPQTGMADYSRGIYLGQIRGDLAAASEAGLCRLNVDGTNDTTFGNPGFHRVTALAVRGDRIAVGGVEIYNPAYILYAGFYGPSPQPGPPFEVNGVRLLTLSGQTLARTDMQETPRVVALQPGQRLYVAPGNSRSLPLPIIPGVGLVQPLGARPDYWGVAAEPSPPVDPSGLVAPEPFYYRIQELDGEINALLPQADGRMLVGGALTKARIAGVLSGPEDTHAVPPAANEVPLNGFVQLDSDGFVIRTVSTLTQSDGLSRLDVPATFRADSPALTSPFKVTALGYDDTPGVRLPLPIQGFGWPFAGTYFIDGPDAAEFEVGPWVDPPGLAYFRAPDPSIIVRCRTHRSGVFRAVLHIVQNGIANPFDIALAAVTHPTLPAGLLVTDPQGQGQLASGDGVDFGSVTTGESKPHSFALENQGTASVVTPLTMTITGADAADFTLTQAATFPIAVGAGSGFTVTFTPRVSDAATRTALLSISNGGFAFELNLTGTALESPTLHYALPPPADTLVLKGQPIAFNIDLRGRGPITWQWSKNGRVLPAFTSNVLSITSASIGDAGTYTVRASNAVGTAKRDLRVAVMDMEARTINALPGRSLTLQCSIARSGPLSFQWALNGTPLSGNAFTGATTATLTIKRATTALAGDYTCTVSMGNARLSSPVITLKVLGLPVIASGLDDAGWRVRDAVNQTVVMSHAPATVYASGLPPGLRLNSNTGVISGTLAQSGTFRVRLRAFNRLGAGPVLEQTVRVTPLLEPARVGSYFQTIIRDHQLNDALGGSLAFSALADGAVTGKLRLGSSVGGVPRLLEFPFAGIFTMNPVGAVAELTLPPFTEQKTGRQIRLSLKLYNATDPLDSASVIGQAEFSVGIGDYSYDGVTYGRRQPLATYHTGRWSTRLLRNVANGVVGDPSAWPEAGTLTATLNRAGACPWVARMEFSTGRTLVATGTSLASHQLEIPLFAWMPERAQARSLVGFSVLQDHFLDGARTGSSLTTAFDYGDWLDLDLQGGHIGSVREGFSEQAGSTGHR